MSQYRLMFRDVVSNLSFSPAASSQLAYYARRLKQESVTRTLSAVMAMALIGLQSAIFLAPPNAATAASTNDIIYGGIGTSSPKKNLLAVYDQSRDSYGHSGYKQLFAHFGITRADLAKTTRGTINSSNHKIKSVGRNPHSALDEPFRAGGREVYYLRPLYTWGDNVSYPALIGKRAVDGKWFAVMLDCGNIAVIDSTPEKPKPPTSKPTPAPQKTPTPTPAPTPAPTTTPSTTVIINNNQTQTQTQTQTQAPPPAPAIPGQPDIRLSKSAILVSADGSKKDANGATAQPGDTIEYILKTANVGSADAKDYIVNENVSDILEYAGIIDPRDGVLNESTGIISWPKATIKPGSEYIASFQTRVKSPLPANPRSVSDPQSFDLKMDDVYGNLISVNLAVPAEKQVEVASATLPQTGPGTSAAIVLILTAAIAYFYMRNRQLAAEIAILQGDHFGGTGR